MKNKQQLIQLTEQKNDGALKISVNGLLILAGTWLLLKISKEILKELEGMGL
jgi:hypothetical protein